MDHRDRTKQNPTSKLQYPEHKHPSFACPLCRDKFLLVGKLDIALKHYSPMMAGITGAIVGHEYGARDPRGGKLNGLSITSDGFVIASTSLYALFRRRPPHRTHVP
jgi:hypothetical protein